MLDNSLSGRRRNDVASKSERARGILTERGETATHKGCLSSSVGDLGGTMCGYRDVRIEFSKIVLRLSISTLSLWGGT